MLFSVHREVGQRALDDACGSVYCYVSGHLLHEHSLTCKLTHSPAHSIAWRHNCAFIHLVLDARGVQKTLYVLTKRLSILGANVQQGSAQYPKFFIQYGFVWDVLSLGSSWSFWYSRKFAAHLDRKSISIRGNCVLWDQILSKRSRDHMKMDWLGHLSKFTKWHSVGARQFSRVAEELNHVWGAKAMAESFSALIAKPMSWTTYWSDCVRINLRVLSKDKSLTHCFRDVTAGWEKKAAKLWGQPVSAHVQGVPRIVSLIRIALQFSFSLRFFS